MSEHESMAAADSSSCNLSMMAAAVEAHAEQHMMASSSSSSSVPMEPHHSLARRPKLVLPTLTPAMQQDLALSKGSGAKSSKPLSIGTRPEYADYPLRGILTPHPNDVLCGRGGGSNNHPGNESFRELVNEVKVPYVNCPKREKPLIARRIVEAVRNQTPPGRFLSKDSKGLWNDIGDGKAREKTSQALREGAPIIRDMIGKPAASPSDHSNVANVLKEAKKAERAEKEYGVRLPRGQWTPGDDDHDDDDEDHLPIKKSPKKKHHHHPSAAVVQESPVLPPSGGDVTAFRRGKSAGASPPDFMSMGGQPVPPLKKFRSLGSRQDFSSPDRGGGGDLDHQHVSQQQQAHQQARQAAAQWAGPLAQHQQQTGRSFGMMHPYPPHHRQMQMGGFAPPPPPPPRSSPHGVPVDYGSSGMHHQPRYPPPPGDSVPFETVRRLLLGQLDPVQLALQLLPPEEAAIVARRHAASNGLAAHPGGGVMGNRGPRPGPAPQSSHHPLLLNPMVSDGSSTSSGDSTAMRRTPSDAYSCGGAAQVGCDDGSSVDSGRVAQQQQQQQTSSAKKHRALPKKKRKFIEDEL